MTRDTVIVPEDHAGRRLDRFLVSQRKGVPKSTIARLLRKGAIRVNGRRARPEHRTVAGDEITMPVLHTENRLQRVPVEAQRRIANAVVHEDDSLLVVDKPSGVPVHTGSGHAFGVIEALRAAGGENLELVHRLDAETSGLVIVAKNHAALRSLQKDVAEGRTRRHYRALVDGAWPEGLRRIDAPLARTHTETRVSERGQDSTTLFAVRRRFGRRATLVDVELVTGRKHQIRVHSAHAGHPIVGDSRYSRARAPRLMLHAARLEIPRPRGQQLSITASIPADFQRVVDRYDDRRRRGGDQRYQRTDRRNQTVR